MEEDTSMEASMIPDLVRRPVEDGTSIAVIQDKDGGVTWKAP
jgi:hypothetical protein